MIDQSLVQNEYKRGKHDQDTEIIHWKLCESMISEFLYTAKVVKFKCVKLLHLHLFTSHVSVQK